MAKSIDFFRIKKVYCTREDKIIEAYSKTGETFRKIMTLMTILCFFCIHTMLDSSDKDLLITSALALPFRLGYISFQLFIVVGPIILLILRIYLQIYYEHWKLLERVMSKRKMTKVPILSFHDHHFLDSMKLIILYLMIPFAMVFFVIKSAALPNWGNKMAVVTLFMTLGHLIFLKRSKEGPMVIYNIALCSLLIFCLVTLFYFSHLPSHQLLRPLFLKNENLYHCNLTEHFLEKANLEESDLQEAKLWRANLKESSLQYANLLKSQLWKADLQRANLQGAILNESYLLEADLSFADLSHAQLKDAYLKESNLIGAKLERAYMRNTNLDFAKLAYADLSDANIKGARMRGTDLRLVKGFCQTCLRLV